MPLRPGRKWLLWCGLLAPGRATSAEDAERILRGNVLLDEVAQPSALPAPPVLPALATLPGTTGSSAPEHWWQQRNLTCLKDHQEGCSAIRDEATCLHSRDGSSEFEQHGLKIKGEPCIWCGGGACHSNGTKLCGPMDFLMRGEGVAFAEFIAKTSYRLASCGAQLPKYDYSCLKSESVGCDALNSAEVCLTSSDGRATTSRRGLLVHGQPCVWCGGLPCRQGEPALCEPFDFAANGDNKEVFGTKPGLRLAACRNGRPAVAMLQGFAVSVPGYVPLLGPKKLMPWWVPNKPDAACLSPSPGGCSAISDASTCLNSRDGSGTLSTLGLKVDGEPCVWCSSGACHSGNSTRCEPFDYLMMGEGSAFLTFFARSSFEVASCRGDIPKPPFDYGCLVPASQGCSALSSSSDCLSSHDASPAARRFGLQVAGEPCVWCAGHTCSTANTTSLCEPFDWLLNGEGRAFTTFYARHDFLVAACTDGAPFPHNYFGPTNETRGIKVNWRPRRAPAWAQCVPGWGGCKEGLMCTARNASYSECVPVGGDTTTAGAAAGAAAAAGVSATASTARGPVVGPRLGADCWKGCHHEPSGCSWCGEGLACCRQGWPSNPPECQGLENYTKPWRHECVGAGMGEVGETSEGAGPSWFAVLIAVLMILLCCLLGAWYAFSGKPKKKKKKTRGVSDLSEDSTKAPLVGEGDLFDRLDVNHDGIVTEAEFLQAMGGTAPAPAAAPPPRRQLDLITVTPWGTNVHHLHGAAPPAGVPVVASAVIPADRPVTVDNV